VWACWQRGAEADLLCGRSDRPNRMRWTDPVVAVLLHGNMGDIERVMMKGSGGNGISNHLLKKESFGEAQRRFMASAERLLRYGRDSATRAEV
jgi:hypothetical protein